MQLYIVLCVVFATALAQHHGDHGHGHATSYIESNLKSEHEKEIHIKAHPHYHYDYNVHDDKHHDYKSKHEARDGYHVKGSYSFLQPDHLVRQVDYESDKKQGWTAKVTYKKHH